MSAKPAYDVSHLPAYAFGHRMPIWWGTLGFMLIEGTGFVMAVAAYFYLASQNPSWPLSTPPPRLLWGTVMLVLLLASELPNFWVKRMAKGQHLHRARWGVVGMSAIGLLAVGVRAFEFGGLNCRWDTDAYGSIVWALMFLHTMHIVTDVTETILMAAMLFIGPVDARRMVDVDENAEYWDFVVFSWVPIYAVLYWAPRWLAS